MTNVPASRPHEPARPHRDPEGERRHLTVMFCDIISSTEIATRIDPEDYAEVLRAFQGSCATVIESLGGKIARFQGDGIMVYFGYPVAHDNDAARSVEAGLALVRSTEALNERLRRESRPGVAVRIGIHTGIAVVTDMGAGDRRELDDVVGETPAIAARLQSLGGPNQIVVSEATRRLTEDRFHMAELGERVLAGIPEPVSVFTVMGESSRRTSSRQRGRLAGRRPEMDQLTGLAERAWAGGAASVVVLGAAGLGKTRLVEETRATRAGAALQSVEVHCSEERRLTPLGALVPVLRSLATPPGAAAPDDRHIDALLAGTSHPEADRAVFASLIGGLVSMAHGDQAGVAYSERDALRRPEAVAAFVEGYAAGRPALIVLEDLHWADPTTLDTAVRLLESTGPGVMVLATARPGPEADAWIPPPVPVVSLIRLTDQEVTAVVEAFCPNLPGEETAELVQRADGIPLFAREL
ncbi:MAG: adenylate/guanylate cyclase domain-containing protein, partial [Tepidiformaceae bacterium]